MSALPPEEAAKHVTIWNRHECRKIAGNAAPLRRNLEKYLKKHPECEEYNGQDKDPNRANNAGAIDPVTGETIGPQNEHVPIWHSLERRKVTGNAAPLKKNLANYLKKHPHCEVYKGQDKKPPSQPPAPHWAIATPQIPAPANPTNPTNPPNPPPPHPYTAQGTAVRWQNLPSKQQMWPPPHAHHQPLLQQHHPQSSTQVANPTPSTELTYNDMVSSWSNNPDWSTSYIPAQPGSFGVPNPGTHHAPILGTHMQPAHMDNTDHINGIPIPGGVARDRPDVVMGASMGASLGASGQMPSELIGFLGITPRSMDHDSDMMQFSPSNYLANGLMSERTPPRRFSYLASPPASLPHQ